VSIRVETDGRVRRIVLNAPDRKNVIDGPASLDLLNAIKNAEEDGQVGALLIEAEGQVFCGGASGEIDHDVYRIGRHATKPIVASAQGVVLGPGLAILAGAHVALAAQGSSFGFLDIREGVWNRDLFECLSRAVGPRRALEVGLTGRVFTTPDALAWGLVHQAAPAFELEDRANAVAHALAEADSQAVQKAIASRPG
jgi:enoyl-CoA hydratase/carnithine racemase